MIAPSLSQQPALLEELAGSWLSACHKVPNCLPIPPPRHMADLACDAVSPIADEKVTFMLNVKTFRVHHAGRITAFLMG